MADPGKTTKTDGKTEQSPIPDVGLLDKPPLGLSKGAAEEVAGSLKIHVKLALEIDIQITARIKGDIAIGICMYPSLSPRTATNRFSVGNIFELGW